METGLTKQRVITELTRSPHGELREYVPIASTASLEDPEFFAHLIAWNQIKGQIRDAKVALPICSLQADYPFVENSLAHLALLDPRNFLRAIHFDKDLRMPGHSRAMRRLVERYIQAREAHPNWWMKTVIQHRASMKSLYAMHHIKPSPAYDAMLFKGFRPPGSALEAVASLSSMAPPDAAAAIARHRLPFLIAVQALGGKAKDVGFVMALIDSMSAAELVTNSKMLERLGVQEVPALRAAYEAGLQKVIASDKLTLKTTRAAEAVGNEKLKAKLSGAQEKQLKKQAVDGNWLVLGDRSQSMQDAIETATLVSATLSKMVSGEVLLVLFNQNPSPIKVTGKTYEQIKEAVKHVTANGSTSIGCGVQYALDANFEPNGIAIVSDGAENSPPMFTSGYLQLCRRLGADIPVYLYWMKCYMPNTYNNNPEALANNMRGAGLDMQLFDLRGGVDYYSLPNVVATMRASRYSLLDEIMETPLLTLDEVFRSPADTVAA